LLLVAACKRKEAAQEPSLPVANAAAPLAAAVESTANAPAPPKPSAAEPGPAQGGAVENFVPGDPLGLLSKKPAAEPEAAGAARDGAQPTARTLPSGSLSAKIAMVKGARGYLDSNAGNPVQERVNYLDPSMGDGRDSVFITKGRHVRKLHGQGKLHDAAEDGDIAKLEELVAAGALVESRDSAGWTALIAAIDNCKLEAAEWLLKHGADANAVTSEGSSALSFATACDEDGATRLLLRHGANPNLATPKRGIAL
jgi:hypothetical protein